MRFTGELQIPRLDQRGYERHLDKFLSEVIQQAARVWLNATVVRLIPIWSGASVATFLPLARAALMPLPNSPVSGAPDRRQEGRSKGSGGIDRGRRRWVYTFHYGTNLEHLIYNEFTNANISPDPTLFFRLLRPGPYNFQEAGRQAFLDFASRTRLPNPYRFIRVRRRRL
jgi:hypothetical protein